MVSTNQFAKVNQTLTSHTLGNGGVWCLFSGCQHPPQESNTYVHVSYDGTLRRLDPIVLISAAIGPCFEGAEGPLVSNRAKVGQSRWKQPP